MSVLDQTKDASARPRPASGTRRSALRLSTGSTRRLAVAGRLGVVWLSIYAVLLGRHASLQTAVILATLLAAVWMITVSKAVGLATTMPTLGPMCAIGAGTVAGLIAVSALALWFREPSVARLLSATTLLEVAACVFLVAWAWERHLRRSHADRPRIVVVTAGDTPPGLLATLAMPHEEPFELVAAVDAADPDRVADVLATRKPDVVVLAMDDLQTDAFERTIDAAGAGFRMVGLREFYEHAFGRVPLETVRADWFMSVLHLYRRPYSRVVKRALDIVLAVVGLTLTGWLFPLIALAVRRTPGAALFRQTRLGERGKPFTIYKFRTMCIDAESSGAAWACPGDPRVTGLGRFLRTSRLDELPQLVNVLRGEMSIVGPRPERPEFHEQLKDAVPFWTRRCLVKPGITGWAQVHSGYASDADGTATKLSYDLWYLRHSSLVVDLAVCAKTVATMATRAGR